MNRAWLLVEVWGSHVLAAESVNEPVVLTVIQGKRRTVLEDRLAGPEDVEVLPFLVPVTSCDPLTLKADVGGRTRTRTLELRCGS